MLAALLHASTDGNPLAHLWWWVEVHTGATDEPGAYYGFWSGFGSDLGEITLITGMFLALRHINCHVTGCRKFRTHIVPGTPYRACRKHHPDVPSDGKITAEHIAEAHRLAKTPPEDTPDEMNKEERQAAVFGAFDGVVSVIGFIFGLMVHGSPTAAIVVGGLGGAVSATVSMGTGQFESTEGPWHRRLTNALFMGAFTLVGSMVPLWPYIFFSKPLATAVAAIGCLGVATWIGWVKHKGVNGFVMSYATLILASAFALGVVSLIPSSA